MRIAMWSGPRNLSTAMMYAFGARTDCAVVDEPFYAAYLSRTGLAHPMRDEILASQSQDPDTVIAALTGSVPGDKEHFYQKHMTQHMLAGIDRDWLAQVSNVFLLRHPARVVASFAAKYDALTLQDIGFTQQTELYETARALGGAPLVIDSHDIRANPERMLRLLCEELGLAWEPSMLRWPRGGHPADGVWAAHWYGAVHKSEGFASVEGTLPELTGSQADLVHLAMPHYEKLWRERLR